MDDVWGRLTEILSEFNWQSLVKSAVSQVLTVFLGVVVAWFVFLRQYWRLWTGDSDEILFHSHYLIPKGEQVALVFRTVAPPTTIRKVYDNVASQKLIRRLADGTSLDDPILQATGVLGFEVLNDLVNYLSGHLAVTSHERQEWLFAATCEDRKVVKKRCIRIFLIRPADLEKFRDWNWCKEKVLCESPWHFFRILALHRMAVTNANRQVDVKANAKADRVNLVIEPRGQSFRIRTLSLGLASMDLARGEPALPNWEEATRYLKSIGAKMAG